MKAYSKRMNSPFKIREKNILPFQKSSHGKEPLMSSRNKLSVTPRIPVLNHFKQLTKELFSPRVSKFITQRNVDSPESFEIRNSRSLKTVTKVPLLRELNYSKFKDYHENSYSKRQKVSKNSNIQEKFSLFKVGLAERLKKKIIVKEDLLEKTIFKTPAVTYADKLFKLNQISSLQQCT
jgi:hypothetical protein